MRSGRVVITAPQASAPYINALQLWIYKGIVQDPYGEFMIEEKPGTCASPVHKCTHHD